MDEWKMGEDKAAEAKKACEKAYREWKHLDHE